MKMKKIDVSSMTKRQLIEKTNTTVIISLAVTAFIVAFAVVFMNFLWDLSSHNRRVISGKSEASKVLKQNVENISAIQTNFTVFEAGDVKSEDVLDALPSKYDFPALATSIESLAGTSGVSLKSFNGDDQEVSAIQSQTEPQPIEITFSMQVEGRYEKVQEFVNNLQRTIRPIKVLSMEMKGNDENMQVSIRAETYYQPSTSLEVETRTIE